MRQTETSQKRYKYVGKERDEETGLYYYGFRYYAAWLCRFVSVDPLQFDYPHYTPFQYAGNKPITYIDLDGLEEALTPYMARVEYVETKNIFDASHNIMALLSNALLVVM
ncbi:RHS repeat-associated core domain-containing protein [Labilibaculum manganireducens]|uniref:RHS repeat-associated core domain-containing protein n=1 Tax=Labilibaculum manganireducens TaxID=1940525 RepID=UPI0029F53D80|nr:RHS repeat-associated core domain-containing protein [Labilibaculum manganireducens]